MTSRILMIAAALLPFLVRPASAAPGAEWTDHFDVAGCHWSATGRNDWFILEPGFQQVLDKHDREGAAHLEITVLNETRKVDGVEVRVIEERESENGELVEISLNYYAVCQPANDVYYFGETTDVYKHGKIVSHEGAWEAGRDGAKAGLFMPAQPRIGARFYQEVAPKVAMDRVEIIGMGNTLKTPAGEFRDCLKTEETTPLEPGVKEYKLYAKGVGIIQDEDLLLTKSGFLPAKRP